ncbi:MULTISPECIES: HAD family hydrolase [unclassified Fusibacter]|uniref:HAD family hydrolase n=1 Tax=unclassified Fusibacter TaxID=2624464 RepID=UPI0013E93C58|nr:MULTISPECIES: HAD family hydrolase [unclassified Fusibacter]MCK8061487.1 HAD family hydrolase [Fusibacter sp. A2]NPE23672.1 HAD family hydrolase [Fusibacter sp. A1]
MKITTVFYDMGNTLLDFHFGKSDDEKDLIGIGHMKDVLREQLNLVVSQEELIESFLNPLNDYMINERKQNGYERPFRMHLKQILQGRSITDEQELCLAEAFYGEYMRTVKVNEAVFEQLRSDKRRGMNIGVISNCYMPAELYRKVFVACGIDEYVDAYFFSYEQGMMKPNLELFKRALHYFDVEPRHAMMVGDSLKADIEPARSLGMEHMRI